MRNIFILILTLLFLIPNIATSKKAWRKKHYVYNEDASAMFSLDSNTVVAMTTNIGVIKIYNTNDAGNTWNCIYEYNSIEHNDSVGNVGRACFCSDTSNIYFSFVERAIIDRSTDGGKSFKRVEFGELSADKYDNFRCISMYNKNIGAAVSYYNIASTTDNWETYKVFRYNYADTTYYSAPMFFIDSAHVVMNKSSAYSNSFMVYNIYTDQLEEYSPMIPAPEGEITKSINDICFINDSLLFGVGRQDNDSTNWSDDVIWRSTDTGKNWNIIFENCKEPMWGLERVHFSDSLNGMAFGPGGKVILTSNGGETWEYHNGPRQYWLSAFWSSTMCGEYPIIWGQACGIYRYEEYSGVNENILEEIEIIPYQSQTDFFIEINDPKHRQYDLTIASLDGKIILEEDINTISQSISTPINLLNLNSGAYVYIVNCGDILVSTGKILNVR